MKLALQFIVEIVFDNCQEGDTIDNEAICEYIKNQLEVARLTGETSTWRPNGVKMTDINVQYEGDCVVDGLPWAVAR